jgi:hypothetical protein
MNKEKWKTLVKDAKPQSKKIIAFLDPKSTASASTARTEVKYTNPLLFYFLYLVPTSVAPEDS